MTEREFNQSISEQWLLQNMTIYESVLNENKNEPQAVRLAMGLEAFLREKEIILSENDVLAGYVTHVYCQYSHPYTNENEVQAIFSDPALASANQDKQRLLDDFLIGSRIGMFWRWPGGHVIAGYDQLMASGLEEKIRRADSILANTEDPQQSFARAVRIACVAARDYILRYAVKARACAQQSPQNKAGLERIADACEWVSVHPARNFFEAVQFLWLIHEILVCEQPCGSLSLGRIDQYLYPYYANDLSAGKITHEEASEIIEALWIKFSGVTQGYQNVTLGGSDADGTYALNDLSYMCLKATKKLKRDQPLVSVRWNKDMPTAFWNEVQELIELGLGFPSLFNDEVCVEAKRRMGVSREDAWNYGIIGCAEISVPGKEFAQNEGLRINWAKVLELLLNQGTCAVTGEKLALKNDSSLDDIKTFSEFYQRYQEELLHFLELGIQSVNVLDAHYPNHYPAPFLSATMTGCLENGGDVTAGTAVYNFSSVNATGMANVVDSLAAIHRIVFEEQKLSLKQLSEIVRDNFADAHMFRSELLSQCPKFGNDDNETNLYMKDLLKDYCEAVGGYSNPRKGRFQSGFYTVDTHGRMGKQTGALPDGRLKGVALVNSLAPVQGADRLGPTAVIKSVTKPDHRLMGNGMVLDLKFHPSFFAKDSHRRAFKSLVETYFELGGMELQFNVVSRETLQKAQDSPQDYQDLIVRVSGFSAYFVTLDKVIQDEIIARTETN